MNRTKSIFALFISILIVITSIVQYHFHDADGAMHLLIVNANDMRPHVHNMSSGSEDNYVCEHRHQQHNTCEDSDSDCGAKLGIPILSKEFSLKHFHGLPITISNPVTEITINVPESYSTILENNYIIPHRIPPYIKYRGLRAPPVA